MACTISAHWDSSGIRDMRTNKQFRSYEMGIPVQSVQSTSLRKGTFVQPLENGKKFLGVTTSHVNATKCEVGVAVAGVVSVLVSNRCRAFFGSPIYYDDNKKELLCTDDPALIQTIHTNARNPAPTLHLVGVYVGPSDHHNSNIVKMCITKKTIKPSP